MSSLEAVFLSPDLEFGDLPEGIDYDQILSRSTNVAFEMRGYIQGSALAPFFDDIPQFLTIKTWSKVSQFDQRSNFWTWFYTLAKRTIFDAVMFLERRPYDGLGACESNNEKSDAESHEDQLDRAVGGHIDLDLEAEVEHTSQSLALDEAIGKLPPFLQEVVFLTESNASGVRMKSRLEAGRRLNALLANPHAELLRHEVLRSMSVSDLDKEIFANSLDEGETNAALACRKGMLLSDVGNSIRRTRHNFSFRYVLAERACLNLQSRYKNLIDDDGKDTAWGLRKIKELIRNYNIAENLLTTEDRNIFRRYCVLCQLSVDNVIFTLATEIGLPEEEVEHRLASIEIELDEIAQNMNFYLSVLSRKSPEFSDALVLFHSLRKNRSSQDEDVEVNSKHLSEGRIMLRKIHNRFVFSVDSLDRQSQQILRLCVDGVPRREIGAQMDPVVDDQSVSRNLIASRKAILSFTERNFEFLLDLLSPQEKETWILYEKGLGADEIKEKLGLGMIDFDDYILEIKDRLDELSLALGYVLKFHFLDKKIAKALKEYLDKGAKISTEVLEEGKDYIRSFLARLPDVLDCLSENYRIAIETVLTINDYHSIREILNKKIDSPDTITILGRARKQVNLYTGISFFVTSVFSDMPDFEFLDTFTLVRQLYLWLPKEEVKALEMFFVGDDEEKISQKYGKNSLNIGRRKLETLVFGFDDFCSGLTPARACAFRLYASGKNTDEIGSDMEISASTARLHLKAAREHISDRLAS